MKELSAEESYAKWAEDNNVSYYSYDTCKEAYLAGYKDGQSFVYSWDLK